MYFYSVVLVWKTEWMNHSRQNTTHLYFAYVHMIPKIGCEDSSHVIALPILTYFHPAFCGPLRIDVCHAVSC